VHRGMFVIRIVAMKNCTAASDRSMALPAHA
jgi:hypothetical protein